jgi:hypothetical protein
MSLDNCKFANVVVLSYDKLVAQLDCPTPEDGTKVVLEDLSKVEGVVQTNVIVVFKKDPEILDWKHKSFHESICGRRLCRVLQSVSRLLRLGE